MPPAPGIIDDNITYAMGAPSSPPPPGGSVDAPDSQDVAGPETGLGATYDPAQVTLNEESDTVAGRISSIIDSNSPLATQAVTRSKQAANRKGLLNSSMAVQSGQEALYNYALPIAQQDASTSYDSNRTNVASQNTALQLGATGTQDLARIGAQIEGESRLQGEQGDITSTLQAERADIDERLINAEGQVRADLLERQGEIDAKLQTLAGNIASTLQAERAVLEEELAAAEGVRRQELLDRQGEIDVELQELRTAGAVELTQIENEYRQIIATSSHAATMYSNASLAIGEILANPDIPAAEKAGLIAQERALLEDGLAVIGGINNLDLVDLLDFDTGSSNPVDVNPPGTGAFSGGYDPYSAAAGV